MVNTSMAAQPIVILPCGGWQGIPVYQRSWLEGLVQKRKLFAAADDAPSPVEPLPFDQLGSVEWNSAAAIVMHPAWVHIIVPFKPRCLIVMLHESEQEEEELWRQCRSWLSASATLVVASSEAQYLEQSFRRSGVFLMDGLDETSDLFAKQAIEWHIDGFESDTLIRLQQRHRANWRDGLLQKQEHTTDAEAQGYADGLFFHSIYRYLTGEADRSRELLLASFERMLLEGREQTLSNVYRFLSAIELEKGRIQDAVRTYGYTAQNEVEWRYFDQMTEWLASRKCDLAKALLYRLNDDYRKAAALLEPLTEDSDARKLLIETYMLMGELRRACALIRLEHQQADLDRKQWLHLQGMALLLEGKRHEAIHCFLQAGENRQEDLNGIIELAVMDGVAREMTLGNKEAN